MMLFYPLIFLWCLTQSDGLVRGSSQQALNYLSSANTIVKGLGKEVINVIPTPQELFKATPQVLFGLPEVAVFQTIKELCSLYMAADTISPRVTPDTDKMELRLLTPCKQLSFPFTQSENLLQSPDFDVNKKLAVFVTGWMTTGDEDYVHQMAEAFNCRGDHNFLVLNASGSIDTLYTWSAYNTEEVGRQLALSLLRLVNQIPAENIHLIGHSLGAHIVGYTGRYFNEYSGLNISRITGLDPANPCFNEGQTLSGLQRGDADFIDIIHTNNGVLGKAHPLGDVDFYPEGLTPIKPGCTRFGCSHRRALEYFTESVHPDSELNFLGVRCTSLTSLNNGFCKGSGYPMGLAVPFNLKGNYFLSVNGKKPYGQNNNDRKTVPQNCGKCNT